MRRLAGVIVLLVLTTFAAEAQFYSFGRNKVQYTDFDWQVLRTEHFQIYYGRDMEDLARRGAVVAEDAYRRLETRFNHSITHPIPLIFYSSHLHFQQTNTTPGFIPEGVGGFFEFIKGRVVIPSDGSFSKFAHVIRHELVHVFSLSKVNRVLIDHRKAADRLPPLWFTEGLAEFWSTDWDTQADMVLRDAVVNGYVVGLDDMDRISGSFLMYKLGQNACQFVARRFGEEKLLLLFENLWRSGRFEEVFKATLGVDFEGFDEQWLYALRKQYFPAMARQDLPSGVARKIVTTGFNAKPVVWQHDGRRDVLFVGNQSGYTSIYRVDADAKDAKPELIVEGESAHEFEAFHPFQSRLSVTTDGLLAFVTKSGETDALHLYDLRSRRLRETMRFRSLVVLGSPAFSPDGKRIAFSSIDRAGNNDLYLVDLGTRNLTRLTNDIYDERDPTWSPDGRTIAFSSDRTAKPEGDVYNLYSIDVATGDIRSLASGPENMLGPSWSPDGRWVAFSSDRDGAQNIWLLDTSAPEGHRTIRQLTSFVTASFDPAWGGRDDLVFTVFEEFSFQLRAFSDISARADTATTVLPVVPQAHAGSWTARSYEGQPEREPLRYTKDYTLDIAQSQITTDPVFGTVGGAALGMSDLLGNDQYSFLVYNTAQVQDELLDNFNIAISRINLGSRVNYAYGVFRFAGNRYDLTDPDLFYYERSFGGYFVLSYPLSKFHRFEAGVTVANSEKDIYVGLPRRALLVSNSMSYVWDNSLWGPTGPLDGHRMKFTLAYTNDVQYSNVSYYTIIADVREYLRLSTRSAWATRVNLWYNAGPEARRFFMGGSWDLRGWPRWSVRGQKLWFASQELRFPFVDQLGLRLPFGSINFGSFRGALFTDAGGAWDQTYRTTLGSVGGGIRWNLGGALVLRYDIGKRVEQNMKRFQPGLFYQFFFGWDF